MRRHETPAAVALVLARHSPRTIKRILDPSVGNGVLLEPFFRRFRGGDVEIIAIDSDSRPLKRVNQKFGAAYGKKLEIVQADFLKWACQPQRGCERGCFDCIVMNPPYAARKHRWRSFIELGRKVGGDGVHKAGPVEAGFVLAAISLLRPGGRLLAILPASLVSAPCLGWVREFMVARGSIRHVHELPRFTFPGIEGRIYLVVYEKGKQEKQSLLLNHDLIEPEKMLIEWAADPSQRLDFGYHDSIAKLSGLSKNRLLAWQRLSALATIWRGTERTPGVPSTVIHTSNYRDGFWRGCATPGSGESVATAKGIKRGDILVKRVSRNCARSFGLADKIHGALVSDCVLVMRPRCNVSSIQILFAIRCLMALDFGPAMLERGTGASYLAQSELGELEIPYALSNEYSRHFRLYRIAVRRRCLALMQKIESEVTIRLLHGPHKD